MQSIDMAELEKNRENLEGKNSTKNPFIEKIKINPKSRDARNAKYYFAQYCGSTSIHGIQYLGQTGRYIIEKIIWLVIIIIIATLASILISKTYHKWVTSPVIVSFSTIETPISDVPFPAVTICPEIKADPNIFNFTDAYIKKMNGRPLTNEEEDKFQTLSLVCNLELHEAYTDPSNEVEFVEDSAIEELYNLVAEEFSVLKMTWMGKTKANDDLVYTSFTSEGVCYSINMLSTDEIFMNPEMFFQQNTTQHQARHWSLDHGYSKGDLDKTYPRRTFISGPSGGLLIDGMMVMRSHLDYACKDSLQGYKVVIHHPAEWPNMDKHFRVPLNSAVYVGVKPRVTTVSSELKHYDPKMRKCYFTDERPLAYFKNYTQTNCLQECLSNYTLRMCNCLGFYMPKSDEDRICGLGSMNCVRDSRVDYFKLDSDKCSCLPSCTTLEYDLEISQSDWDWHRAIHALRAVGQSELLQDFEQVHMSRLAIYYKDIQFLGTERHELYGVVDFLSNVGGLLGLFIGISLTSFIEIVYFCTLRLYCNFKKYGRRYWSGEPDLIDEDERNDNQAL